MKIHKIAGLYPIEDWKNDRGHISALTKGGKIICFAEGSLAGVPKISNLGHSCHSEMAVVKTLFNKGVVNFSKYKIYNIRWDNNGSIKDSKPCIECQKSLLKLGFKDIVYSNQDGTFTKAKLKDIKCFPTRINRK